MGGETISSLSEVKRDRGRARSLGYVFQTFNLLQGYSTLEKALLEMLFGSGADGEFALQPSCGFMKSVWVCLAILIILWAGVAQATQFSVLRGRVIDSSGLVVPGATVTVYRADTALKTIQTSAAGEFGMMLDVGDYQLEVAEAGFSTHSVALHLKGQSAPLVIQLSVAQLSQTLNVTEAANAIGLDADSALNTTVLKKEMVDALPDDPDDLVAYLSQIAGSRGEAGDDGVIIVDGFLERIFHPRSRSRKFALIIIRSAPSSAGWVLAEARSLRSPAREIFTAARISCFAMPS